MRVLIAIAVVTVVFAIVTYSILGNKPETFIAIATIALVAATVYVAYFNMKLWHAQDRPWLRFHVGCDDRAGGDRFCFLYVTNIGRGPALDVNFKTLNREFHYDSLTPGIGQWIEKVSFPLPPDGIQNRDINYTDINQIRIQQDDQTIHR
jgi:hypothetical protein